MNCSCFCWASSGVSWCFLLNCQEREREREREREEREREWCGEYTLGVGTATSEHSISTHDFKTRWPVAIALILLNVVEELDKWRS